MSAVVMRGFSPNVRTAIALGAAGAVSVLCVFPYVLTLLPPDQLAKLPPLPIVVIAQSVQAALLYTLLAWAGLRVGAPLGLDAPRTRRWMNGGDAALPAFPWRAVLVGAALALVAVLAIASGAKALLPELARVDAAPRAAWKGLLASFYGGIGEELQLRLFLMTMLAWLLMRARLKLPVALGAANVLAALAFGAGHLPAAAGLLPLTAGVVAYIVSANAAAGIVFGALYVRHGLEAAIAAHFLCDIGLHVIVPLTQGGAS